MRAMASVIAVAATWSPLVASRRQFAAVWRCCVATMGFVCAMTSLSYSKLCRTRRPPLLILALTGVPTGVVSTEIGRSGESPGVGAR
eukprot:8935139-Pyramimonas_sp.AAC.1